MYYLQTQPQLSMTKVDINSLKIISQSESSGEATNVPKDLHRMKIL